MIGEDKFPEIIDLWVEGALSEEQLNNDIKRHFYLYQKIIKSYFLNKESIEITMKMKSKVLKFIGTGKN